MGKIFLFILFLAVAVSLITQKYQHGIIIVLVYATIRGIIKIIGLISKKKGSGADF